MSLIAETLQTYLPPKRKHTPSGWIGFNAVCCDDKRQRGGFIVNGGDAISYHCFNCGFKCSWQPGRLVSPKLKTFMRNLHIPDDVINKMVFDALRLKESSELGSKEQLVPIFTPRALPLNAMPIAELVANAKPNKHLIPVLEYLHERKMFLDDYNFYWCDEVGFKNRLIIPFLYRKDVVGWTARIINDGSPKYLSEQQPGYVFNLDAQDWSRKYVIVCEGPFDAISIGGVALLGSEIKSGQHLLINQLQREVILVPDRDDAGEKTVEQAIDLGWTVSMPDWPEGIKDINDAVRMLGKPATLWLIINSRAQSELKIRLQAKTWFRKDE